MIKITDLLGAFSQCVEARRQLVLCRQRATGNVDYYSYGYQQDLTAAEAHLEATLDAYIDQRLEEKAERRSVPTAAIDPQPVWAAGPTL